MPDTFDAALLLLARDDRRHSYCHGVPSLLQGRTRHIKATAVAPVTDIDQFHAARSAKVAEYM